MADDQDSGEKTHEPTGRRRQQFREQGQVPRSQDLLGLTVLFIGMGSVLMLGPSIADRIVEYTTIMYSMIADSHFDAGTVALISNLTLWTIWDVVALPMFYIWLGVIIVGLIQGQFIIPKEPLKFAPEKLDPVDGFKQKFLSSQPLVELVKGLLKLFLLGWVVWLGISDKISLLPAMINASPTELPMTFSMFATIVFWRAIAVGVLLVVLDYSYQWYQIRQKMMMTRQEVKEEMKSSEGDPQFKSLRRQRQYEIAMGQAIKNVPDADVVVTNPTHFAVAIRYRREDADAPVVLARGVDFLALRIRELATSNDVPIVENPPLARGLYYKTKVGQQIPPEFYSAVAEVLAAIYRRRGARRQRPV